MRSLATLSILLHLVILSTGSVRAETGVGEQEGLTPSIEGNSLLGKARVGETSSDKKYKEKEPKEVENKNKQKLKKVTKARKMSAFNNQNKVKREKGKKEMQDINTNKNSKNTKHGNKCRKNNIGKCINKKKRKNNKKRKSKKSNRKKKTKAKKNNTRQNKDMTSKEKQRKNKQKRMKTKRQKVRAERQPSPTTCSGDQVSDDCILNAVSAMKFEKNQIQNFKKQKMRMAKNDEITANKITKWSMTPTFEVVSWYLMQAMGGNMSDPQCGDGHLPRSTKDESMSEAMVKYKILGNCSNSIKEACTIPLQLLSNQTFLDDCLDMFETTKADIEKCRLLSTLLETMLDGPLQCACWEKVTKDIEAAKKKECTMRNTAKVTKQKVKCIAEVKACKKAEDAARSLVETCTYGKVNVVPGSGEGK